MLGIFILEAFFVEEHGLSGTQASVVTVHRLSCHVTCGILVDLISSPCPSEQQADSQLLDHQGCVYVKFFLNFYLFLIEGELLYKIVLVSAVHQHESATGIQTYVLSLLSLPLTSHPIPPL